MKMDAKTVKIVYIALAFIIALCAIAASYLQQYYVALGLIVLASAVILGGAILVSYLYKMEKAEELKKL
jgi:general stress protein CsbA